MHLVGFHYKNFTENIRFKDSLDDVVLQRHQMEFLPHQTNIKLIYYPTYALCYRPFIIHINSYTFRHGDVILREPL